MRPAPPKKHHYVPECYLKNFTGEDGRFYILDTVKLQKGWKVYPRPVYPGQVCYLPDYYRIDTTVESNFRLKNHPELFVEMEVLKKLENAFPRVYKQLIETWKLTFDDACMLVDFIIQLKLRNPYWREKVIGAYKDQWIDEGIDRIAKEKLSAEPRFAHIPEHIQELVFNLVRADNKANPEFQREMQLFGLVERYNDNLSRNEMFRKALMDCNWNIFKAPPTGPKFIVTDNPGVTFGSDNLFYNIKLTAGFMLCFPLSPEFCLVIGDAEQDFAFTGHHPLKKVIVGPVDENVVYEINNASLSYINALMISSEADYLQKTIDTFIIRKV